MNKHNISKRLFLRKSILGTVSGITGFGIVSGCKGQSDEAEVSPAEDLMREHGVLNRILLIYDNCRTRLANDTEFPMEALNHSATIIRNFIEDYHEKLEEDYLFPRFEKAGQLTELVQTLRAQHQAGRMITDLIIEISKSKLLTSANNLKLTELISQFVTMYRPHEAREDTVLFPALREIVSKHEYDSLGEDFERKEHQLFGEDGFDVMVQKVTSIEKQVGLYELDQFTPDVKV